MADLSGKKVAILVDNYFEEPEFSGPLQALKDAGADVDIVTIEKQDLQSMEGDTDKAKTYQADKRIDDIRIDGYDALVLPGGTVNADNLRTNSEAQLWVKQFLEQNKPVAAICHAPWILVSANIAKGRTLTSFPSLQDDLKNAGANWIDQEVVIDNSLITSRNPDDVPAFSDALITMLSEQ